MKDFNHTSILYELKLQQKPAFNCGLMQKRDLKVPMLA